jgi:3-oxoacyl-[acyl-carrier-protein] synthase II
MPNAPAAAIARKFSIVGPVVSVSSACASGADAIVAGVHSIQSGETDLAVVGGVEAAVTSHAIKAFAALRALATGNDDPRSLSRPFDVNRRGFVLAEGAGAIVLEELSHAQARGAVIYGEIAGYGRSNDAYRMTDPLESGLQAARAIQGALRLAKVSIDAVDYVNAHATSTRLGDAAESVALEHVSRGTLSRFVVSATKSMLGHSLGAAAALETISVLLTLRHGIIPPTVNTEHCDLAIGHRLVRHAQFNMKVHIALKNSFGFGGHNTALVLSNVTL